MQKILSAMIITIAVVCSVSVAAQWPKQEDPGVPRDAQGRPRLARHSTGNPARMVMGTRGKRPTALTSPGTPRSRQTAATS